MSRCGTPTSRTAGARAGIAPGASPAGQDRLERRLLRRLAEPGAGAEVRAGEVALSHKGRAVSLPLGLPGSVLAALVEAGAVAGRRIAGREVFAITDAGRARLRREDAGAETPFADQHREIALRETEVEGERRPVRVNLREDPLELFRRGGRLGGMVGAAEIEAGERLRRDLVLAQTVPRVTADWSRIAVDGAGYRPGLAVPERIAAARRRVEGALGAAGPDFAGILIDVLGFSKGIESLEREKALPVRSGKVVLALALRALARHYGLASEAVGAPARGIRHWGAADYRPNLGAG